MRFFCVGNLFPDLRAAHLALGFLMLQNIGEVSARDRFMKISGRYGSIPKRPRSFANIGSSALFVSTIYECG
jgi:hypothetical protein